MTKVDIKIDVKHRIRHQGKYWAGINTCPGCHFQPDTIVSEIIGFTNTSNGMMCVVQCPKCAHKWYFHSRDIYRRFLKKIELGMQKHFKKL